LSGLLLAVTTYCAVIGLLAVASGDTFERCPHCRRYCLSDDAGPHPAGCPESAWTHLVHLLHFAHRRRYDAQKQSSASFR
jgi:hypothetical protein